MQNKPFTLQEAQDAKTANIIGMGWDFSTMTRVFAKQSSTKILEQLKDLFAKLDRVSDRVEYERLHSDFCYWFTGNVCTAAKRLPNGRIKAGGPSSYGHAAKVLDIAVKVYVYYCAQPSPDAAQRLVPMLHAALDTEMMQRLCPKSPERIQEVDRVEYERLQALVTLEIGESGIHPVQYDDIVWRRLQPGIP